MGKIISKQGQSLFDIALQVYGSIEGVFGLLQQGKSLSDLPEPGTQITVSGNVMNKYIVDQYRFNAIIPATGLINSTIPGSGIGWWIINDDFVVQ